MYYQRQRYGHEGGNYQLASDKPSKLPFQNSCENEGRRHQNALIGNKTYHPIAKSTQWSTARQTNANEI